MHRIINMNVMTAAIFLMMGTCFSKANAEEINGVKYTVDGSSVGEKYWEKQVINTNLYDT